VADNLVVAELRGSEPRLDDGRTEVSDRLVIAARDRAASRRRVSDQTHWGHGSSVSVSPAMNDSTSRPFSIQAMRHGTQMKSTTPHVDQEPMHHGRPRSCGPTDRLPTLTTCERFPPARTVSS